MSVYIGVKIVTKKWGRKEPEIILLVKHNKMVTVSAPFPTSILPLYKEDMAERQGGIWLLEVGSFRLYRSAI